MSCKGCSEKQKKLVEAGTRAFNGLTDQAKEIADGWIHVLKNNPEVELVARARERICKDCPHKEVATVPVINKEFERCGICKCPITAKVRSMSTTCPDDPPRWKLYQKTIHVN